MGPVCDVCGYTAAFNQQPRPSFFRSFWHASPDGFSKALGDPQRSAFAPLAWKRLSKVEMPPRSRVPAPDALILPRAPRRHARSAVSRTWEPPSAWQTMPPRERANASGAQMSDLALIGRSVQKKFEGAPLARRLASPTMPSESSSSDLSIHRAAQATAFSRARSSTTTARRAF